LRHVGESRSGKRIKNGYTAILLLIGYKLRLSALIAGVLLISFATVMTLSLGIKSTFDYSVWVGASACFLLRTAKSFPFSMDHYISGAEK